MGFTIIPAGATIDANTTGLGISSTNLYKPNFEFVTQSIEDLKFLLLTHIGEIPNFEPNFGTRLLYVLFEPNLNSSELKENINEILVGYNTLGKKEYHGPCNPENKMHNYNFYLYGIKGDLDKQDNNMKKEFINTKSSNTYELLLKKNNLKIILKKNKKFQYKSS